MARIPWASRDEFCAFQSRYLHIRELLYYVIEVLSGAATTGAGVFVALLLQSLSSDKQRDA